MIIIIQINNNNRYNSIEKMKYNQKMIKKMDNQFYIKINKINNKNEDHQV